MTNSRTLSDPPLPNFWTLEVELVPKRCFQAPSISMELYVGKHDFTLALDLSEAIHWILINNYCVHHLLHYLDNFLAVRPPEYTTIYVATLRPDSGSCKILQD